jgi:hypothetical protein
MLGRNTEQNSSIVQEKNASGRKAANVIGVLKNIQVLS